MTEALVISFALATITSLILTILGLVFGFIHSFYNFPLKNLVSGLFLLPALLPPTVIGFYLLFLLNPESPLGYLYNELTGRSLVFSFEGLIIASVIYSLPLGIFPIKDAFERVSKRYIEIAFVFGYSKFETFIKVIVPNSINGIVSAFALTFARTLGEFGAVLMVGGNIPGKTQTISIYIYEQVQVLNYSEANKVSLILILISIISLTLILMAGRRWNKL